MTGFDGQGVHVGSALVPARGSTKNSGHGMPSVVRGTHLRQYPLRHSTQDTLANDFLQRSHKPLSMSAPSSAVRIANHALSAAATAPANPVSPPPHRSLVAHRKTSKSEGSRSCNLA